MAVRALRLLEQLGLVSSVQRGRTANEYMLHLDWLAEIRLPICQEGLADVSARHIERAKKTHQAREKDTSIIRGYNHEPTNNQPTTTTALDVSSEPSSWAVVVGEVRAAGVSRAEPAVDAARANGATIDDVRSTLAYWREHRRGWTRPDVVLYRRLCYLDPSVPVSDGWPSLSEEYQRRLDSAERAQRNTTQIDAQLQRRKEGEARRAEYRTACAQGLSIVAIAREIDPTLARGVETAIARREARAPERANLPRPP